MKTVKTRTLAFATVGGIVGAYLNKVHHEVKHAGSAVPLQRSFWADQLWGFAGSILGAAVASATEDKPARYKRKGIRTR